MICKNRFCVYNDKELCTLEEIEIDISGSCSDCIYINFKEEELAKRRNKQLVL